MAPPATAFSRSDVRRTRAPPAAPRAAPRAQPRATHAATGHACAPAATLAEVLEWLGLEPASGGRGAAEQVLAQLPVRAGANRKYVAHFCEWVARDGCAGYRTMLAELGPRVEAAGYSLAAWGVQCEAECARA
eukprot:7387988-Prymnesium_polylepis.1